MRPHPARLVVTSALLLAFAGSLQAQQGATKGEWRYYGGDQGNTRYSPLDQINARNVKELEIVWRWKADNFGPTPDYNWEVTPLMIGGVLYFTAGSRRDVVAVNAATGETLWMYRLDEGERGDRAPRKQNRGLAYWTDGRDDTRLLLVTPGYQLVALDAKTGPPHPDVRQGRDRRAHRRSRPRRREAGPDRFELTGDRRARRHRRRGRDDRRHRSSLEGARARLHPRFRRPHGQAYLDVQDHPATRRVRPRDVGTATPGSTPATPARGRPWPAMKSSATSTSPSRRRPAISTAAIAWATTCSGTASSASMRRPASGSGTSRWSTTTSGTGNPRHRRSSPTSPSAGRGSRRSPRSRSRRSPSSSIA